MAATSAAHGSVDFTWRKIRLLLDGHPVKMMRFIDAAYGPSALHAAWDEFRCGGDAPFDPASPLMQLFMPWFFYCWSPGPADTTVRDPSLLEVSPAKAYLAAQGRRVEPLLRRYMESLLHAPFTFFEVMAFEPGSNMTLRDIMTGEVHVVTERAASKAVKRGDLLFGQLASVDQLTMLEASNGFTIPPMEKAPVIEMRARIATAHPKITPEILRDYDFELLDLFHEIADRQFNPPMPIMRNTDDETLVLQKLVFDLDVPPQAAFDALRHLAVGLTDAEVLEDSTRNAAGELTRVRFRWLKLGNKMHAEWENTTLGAIEITLKRLVAEVNSQTRATALREAIETALGEGIRYRASEIQSPEKILTDARTNGDGGSGQRSAASAESKRLAALPEVREKIAEMMAAHWERWVDIPLPILGNRTPMNAVKDADGREIVESIIIQAERRGLGMDMPMDPAVLSRLRARLGLAES